MLNGEKSHRDRFWAYRDTGLCFVLPSKNPSKTFRLDHKRMFGGINR